MIDPKCINFSGFGVAVSVSPIVTSPTVYSSFSLDLHYKYLVVNMLYLKSLDL